MTIQDNEDYRIDNSRYMMSIALHHLRVGPTEFALADDIVIDSGSPEHMFKLREEIESTDDIVTIRV